MRKAYINLDETRVVRRDSAMERLHMPRQYFFRNCHRARRRSDWFVRFSSACPRLHESKQSAIPCNTPGEFIERTSQFFDTDLFAAFEAFGECQVGYRKHSIVDEVLTMNRRNARGIDDSKAGIQQG